MSENYPYTNKNQILRINRPYFCPYFQFLPNAILPNVIMNISLPELWVSAHSYFAECTQQPKKYGKSIFEKMEKVKMEKVKMEKSKK